MLPLMRATSSRPRATMSPIFIFDHCCYIFKISQSFIYNFFKHYIFFSCVYTGCYSDPVACGALNLGVAAGGAGHKPGSPPGPRFHQSLSSVSCVSTVSKLLLSTGKGTP